MNWTSGITEILLISFCPTLTIKMHVLDKKNEQVMLAHIIDLFLKNDVGLLMKEEATLHNIRNVLKSLYNQLHSDTPNIEDSYAPHLQQLINCFFWHFFMEKAAYTQVGCPWLLKIDARIFLHFDDNSLFAPEVFSCITSRQYPNVFNWFKEKDSDFLKYLINHSDGTSSLLLPEFPFPLKRRIYNLYNNLVLKFLELEHTFETDGAKWVKEYLINMRDFFNVQNTDNVN